MKQKNHSGFSLIEVMVGMAVFVIFAMGIYSGIQYVFKVVYQSRLRILETAIMNEQIEIMRNMSFYDVGIINGSPAGVLEHMVTTTRNNIDFIITRTIRNIDDPYDGTIGGEPNDTSPADYKLVDIEIICNNCNQRVPYGMTTFISPKYLEGDPTHGALFIEVFDADAEPVQGASVHIVATSTDPAVDFIDTTDNEGKLQIVDLGEGIQAYDITVTKTGYTTDQTIRPGIIENPIKPPASVVAQNVTEISFSIDKISVIDLSAINQYCTAMTSVPVNILGTKLLGVEPDVFKVDQNITTNGDGLYTFANLEWDAYGFRVADYDLLGTIPSLPLSLPAGTVQPLQLILGANTTNSLLVSVRDSITRQPVSSASVHITGEGYNQMRTTGIGFSRQTDWSGGTGQLNYVNETKYWSDDGKIENFDPAGDIKLAKVGLDYVSSAILESSVFDLGVSVNFVNLNWEPLAQPIATGDDAVRWQIATSNSSTPAFWDYLGPDGMNSTYYNDENFAISEVHNGDQYFRYKIYLSTASSSFTPTVSDFTVSYTTSCTAPGQVYFGNLAAQEYTVEVLADGYQSTTQSITPDGDIIFGIDLVAL